MILVTGATGQLGRAVIEHLAKGGDPGEVAGLVRDEGKASDLKALGVDVRVGDYDDAASLGAAMRGVGRVLLISGTEMDPARSLQQHANVIDAAKRAGVGYLAYTGRAMRDPSASASELMKGHFRTEDLVRESGMTFGLFRNALYLESLAYFLGKGRPEPGQKTAFEADIRLPAGQGKVAYALRAELGEGIANALLRDPAEDRVYTLTAGEAWSFDDVARTLGELSGKPASYTPTDRAGYETMMSGRGLSGPMIHLLSGFYRDIGEGQLDEVTPELEGLLGRKPAALGTGLATLFHF